MHYYGTQFAMLPIGIVLAILPPIFVFAPTFHKMGLTSAYEVLQSILMYSLWPPWFNLSQLYLFRTSITR